MSAPANRDKSPVRGQWGKNVISNETVKSVIDKIMAIEDAEMKLLATMRSAYVYRRNAVVKILYDITSAVINGDTNTHQKEMFSEHHITKREAYTVVGTVESVLEELKFQKYNFIIRDTYIIYDVIAPK
jgi:hypothetical protein